MSFLLGLPIFRDYVKFLGCKKCFMSGDEPTSWWDFFERIPKVSLGASVCFFMTARDVPWIPSYQPHPRLLKPSRFHRMISWFERAQKLSIHTSCVRMLCWTKSCGSLLKTGGTWEWPANGWWPGEGFFVTKCGEEGEPVEKKNVTKKTKIYL